MEKLMNKPILFSGEMVRAILDGNKTQTRRIVKPQPNEPMVLSPNHERWPKSYPREWCESGVDIRQLADGEHPAWNCPYGAPGDLLWVRETWKQVFVTPPVAAYRATEPDEINGGKWRPSIHMPRWASRLTLKITDVQVERVQAISESSAESEGITESVASEHWHDGPQFVGAFADLWNSLNEKRGFGWQSNPWVWVISFEPSLNHVDASLNGGC
jgi:hypothetical protein